ncbi:nuclear envelope pore membrane protein POM 121 isoform X2 [Rhinatrema bivittatum]|uniref:nuclear envelope pore membrane protein POM 121 isoform X2 n=1 Tax=Rhinatrema bivittatum TaxID=194408 RepID=UPI001125D5AB|nr:nuclear envelope pore membrane protein POM 121 isoform X2 [Rhinatrema bivittatum]
MSPAGEGLGQRRRRWRGRRQQPVSQRSVTVAAALVLLGLAVACTLLPTLAWLCLAALGTAAAAGCCWGYCGTELPLVPRLALSQDVRLNGAPGQRNRAWQQQEEEEVVTRARALEFSPVDPSLMGSYLCRSEAPTAGARPRDIRERLAKPNPALPSPTKRLSFGESRGMANRYRMIPRRRYPIHQPQYSALGSLPMVQWDGYQRKNVLSLKNSYMVHSPVTVKIAPLDVNISRSQLVDQLLSPVLTVSPKRNAPDPCARETVLNAIKDCRKRVIEEEEQTASNGQENKRRRHDSSGSGQSAFESLVANGAPAYLIPKPGSLKRGLNSQYVEDPLNKRSRTSSSSSLNSTSARGILSSVRNAITSSYSSTRGFQQKWKRIVRSTSALSSLSSSRSQTPERPAKKAKEDELLQTSASPPEKPGVKKSPPGKVPETPVLRKQISAVSSSSPESGGKRKRKIPLLLSRRGDPLTLPPPPQLGRSVTAEDLDAEKRAAIQRLNKALEEKNNIPSSAIEITPPESSLPFTLSTTGTSVSASTPVLPPLPSVDTNPLLKNLNKIQCPPAHTEPAGGTTQTPSPLASIFTSVSSGTLGTCTLTVTPSNPTPVLASPSVSMVPSASEPANSTTLPKLAVPPSEPLGTKLSSSSSPKQGILFGMLSGATPNSTMSPANKEAASTFKPVFPTPLKVENAVSPLVNSSEACSAPLGPVTGVATNTTFKPIFGNFTPATNSSTTVSPFTFNKTPVATINASPAAAPTTSSSVQAGLHNAIYTASPAVGTSTTQSNITDSTVKASFNFGLSNAPSSTAANTTVAHSFQFGAIPNPAPSTAAGFGTGFQFNKLPATTTVSSTAAPQPASVFDQAPPAGTKIPFGIFGSASTAVTTTSNSQPSLTLGSSISAFSAPFGSSGNAPPPYPGTTGQPAFSNNTADAQQIGSKPASVSSNFSTSNAPFSFGVSTVQPAFGNAAQPHFPQNNSQAPFSASNTQPTFGNTASAFFGTATPTTGTFGSASTQTTTSSTSGLMFGGITSLTFGMSNPSSTGSSAFNTGAQSSGPAPATSGFNFGQNQSSSAAATFGIGLHSSSSAPVMTPFGFGGGQSGSASTGATFGSPAVQSQALSTQNQRAQFSFGTPGAAESKLSFGGQATAEHEETNPARLFIA